MIGLPDQGILFELLQTLHLITYLPILGWVTLRQILLHVVLSGKLSHSSLWKAFI